MTMTWRARAALLRHQDYTIQQIALLVGRHYYTVRQFLYQLAPDQCHNAHSRDRDRAAMRLRAAGASWQEIAETLGYSTTDAARYLVWRRARREAAR